jgi:hypothetical protein
VVYSSLRFYCRSTDQHIVDKCHWNAVKDNPNRLLDVGKQDINRQILVKRARMILTIRMQQFASSARKLSSSFPRAEVALVAT